MANVKRNGAGCQPRNAAQHKQNIGCFSVPVELLRLGTAHIVATYARLQPRVGRQEFRQDFNLAADVGLSARALRDNVDQLCRLGFAKRVSHFVYRLEYCRLYTTVPMPGADWSAGEVTALAALWWAGGGNRALRRRGGRIAATLPVGRLAGWLGVHAATARRWLHRLIARGAVAVAARWRTTLDGWDRRIRRRAANCYSTTPAAVARATPAAVARAPDPARDPEVPSEKTGGLQALQALIRQWRLPDRR